MKNGAIYVRVSTEEQAREGYSIDAQIKAIKEYALKNNIYIDNQYIFKDEGISGRKAEKRPAFMEMIGTAKLKPKKFDAILVHKFDRFSRNREDSIVYKSLLKKEYGINVISISEPLDPDDKMSIILEAFLEAMAEYYSINLSEEVKKGQLEKHDLGELQTRPCLGYDVIENQLIINEEESKIVKLVFELYTNQSTPILSIAKKLNNLGVKTKKGNLFENRSITYILNNPTYIGKLRYTPGKRTTYCYDDPNTIIVEGKHQPLITQELWKLTQNKLEENNKFRKKHQILDYSPKTWLKGLVRCKECNCTLVTLNRSKMRCNGYNKGKCSNNHSFYIKDAENLVIEQLKIDFTSGIIKNIVNKAKTNDNTSEYDIIIDNIKNLKIKEQRIKEAYINGVDSLKEYQSNKELLVNEKNKLQKQLKNLKTPKTMEQRKKHIIENGKMIYEMILDENIEIQKKYEAINTLINHIEYNGESALLEIYYN